MLILFLALFHIVKSNDSRKIVRRNCKQNHTVGFFKRKMSVRSKAQSKKFNYINVKYKWNVYCSKFVWPSLISWNFRNQWVCTNFDQNLDVSQLSVSSIILRKLDFKCFLLHIDLFLRILTEYLEDKNSITEVPYICHEDCA